MTEPMTRPIKFRAWDTEKLMMHEPSNSDALMMTRGGEVYNIRADDYYKTRYVLLQSTGLHDVNGVEIFEGDVVEKIERWGNEDDRFTVAWSGTGWEPFQHTECNDYIDWDQRPEVVMVIGNVHEHPDLIAPKEAARA